MQSSGTPYQGSAPHAQYSDHTYDNPMGVHCPPGGYQGYVNGPYPVASPRPPHPHHHYGGHQMQQGVPYRGAYPPTQNQYGPPPNQDMYRNHHSAYVGTSHNGNRNMPVKPVWGENNTAEMMPVYNHVPPRPPMMPSSPAMNVSSMRSPPHLPSNINPVPSPGAQHYRQMQSPGHSPQTWPQAQVPSPVMHHASRATPSPLPPHARSPGHSQPFSPPSATHITSMPNITPHSVNSVLPENCQPSPMVSQQVPNKNSADPLHSLQKMVMLDQNADQIQMNCHMTNENCDQLSMHHSNQMMAQQNVSDESKDSPYATYFNLDENRLESEPQSSTPKPSEYIQGNSANYGTNSPRIINNDIPTDMSQPMKSPHLHILNPPDNNYHRLEPVHVVAPQASTANLPQAAQNQINGPSSHIPNSVPKTTEPSLANSAPIIINSQQSPNNRSASLISAAFPTKLELCNTVTASVREIHVIHDQQNLEDNADELKEVGKLEHIKSYDDSSSEGKFLYNQNIKPKLSSDSNSDQMEEDYQLSVNKGNSSEVKEETAVPCPERQNLKHPSIIKLAALKQEEESGSYQDNDDVKPVIDEVVWKAEQSLMKLEESREIAVEPFIKKESSFDKPSSSNSHKANIENAHAALSCNESEISGSNMLSSLRQFPKTTNLKSIVKSRIVTTERVHNPVKVVIHRIRTNPTTDASWHVPNEEDTAPAAKESSPSSVNSVTPRTSNTGPQIIILSSASAHKKSNVSTATCNSKSTCLEQHVVTSNRTAVNKSLASKLGAAGIRRERLKARCSSEGPRNSPKKAASGRGRGRGRGKVIVRKVKEKAGMKKRKGRMKKNIRHKPVDIEIVEVAPKLKKAKPFHGPYVHVTGSRQKPSSITIVNMALKDEDKGKLMRAKVDNLPKRPRVGHTSTLSPHYDAFNKDRTWLCTFCNKGSHCSGLGDLYGPYYTKNEDASVNKDASSSSYKATPTSYSTPRGVRSKRRKSDLSASESEKPPGSKKARLSNKVEFPVGKESFVICQGEQGSSSENAMKEVWIHEDCAVWCQSISLMGSQIHGLDDAIQESNENVCSSCKFTGATLGCWGKGCKEQYHFSCAKEKGCQLDIENFSLFCPKHKLKRSVSSPKNSKKSSESLQ